MNNTKDSPASENIVSGIFWMLATMCMFTTMDTVAKTAMVHLPTEQVIWGRFTFHMICLLVFLRSSVPSLLVSNNYILQLSRSLFLFIATSVFFYGLTTTGLAKASTIMFLSPILVTVLAIPLLGEQVGVRRWIGVLVGFIGAVIVVQPDTGAVAAGDLFVVAAAICTAVYQILTRQVHATDHAMTTLLYSGIAGAIFTSLYIPTVWQTPTAFSWLLLMLTGFLGAAGHFCLIRAFRLAPASAVVPFTYSSLLWATLYGFVFFNTLPDRWTLLGASLIIGSGLYIFHREQNQRRSRT